MTITTAQIRKIHVLLPTAVKQDKEQKQAVMMQYTGDANRCSTKHLTFNQANALIVDLGGTPIYNKWAGFDAHIQIEKKRKRSIVLTIATSVGIHDANDWGKFNGFMLKRSVCKKALNTYDIDELDALIGQFRGIESNYKKSSNQTGTKAWRHKHGFSEISMN